MIADGATLRIEGVDPGAFVALNNIAIGRAFRRDCGTALLLLMRGELRSPLDRYPGSKTACR